MKAELLIREATIADRPAIAKLTRLAYAEFAGPEKTKSWIDYEKRTEETILNENDMLRIIAHIKTKIVGAVLFCPPYKKLLGSTLVDNIYPEMRLLAVLNEFRNLGIGAKLIDECEKRAKDKGFRAITLHTTILMQTAKAMYERRGYTRYSELDFEPSDGFIVWGYKKQLE